MNIVGFIAKLREMGIKIRLVDDNLKITSSRGKVPPEVLNEIKEKKSDIIDFLRDLVKKHEDFEIIKPVEKREFYPLSSAQKRMYILYRMKEDSIVYNIASILELKGLFDIGKGADGFFQLIRRHESLRTSFHSFAGSPIQRVHEPADIHFNIEKYHASDGTIDTIICRFIRPFDLACAPLFRVGVVELEEHKFILMLDIHHIISDGTSLGILNSEFIDLYAGNELPPVGLQYKDYTMWQNSELGKKHLIAQENFWFGQFAGKVPDFDLPLDFPRPAERSFTGNRLIFFIDQEQSTALNKIARDKGCTLFMVLLSIFNILMTRLTNQEDIIVGTPTAGRSHAKVQNTIGMFVNTLVLRHLTPGTMVFDQYLQQVKEQVISVFENQEYPFDYLVEKLTADPAWAKSFNRSRNPVFDVMFALQNIDFSQAAIPQLTIEAYPFEPNIAKFDLNFIGQEINEKLRFEIEYSTGLFHIDTIERFAGYYREIAAAVAANPTVRLRDIILSSELGNAESTIAAEAEGDFGF